MKLEAVIADGGAAPAAQQPAAVSLRAAHTVVVAADIARVVEQHYGIDAVGGSHLLRRGFNEVYLLTDADGVRHVARLSALRARGPANVDYEVALLRHAGGRGANVAAPLLTITDDASVALALPEGQRALTLFQFAEGEPPEGPDDLAVTGEALAALHTASESYTGPASLYTLDAQHLVRRPLAWLLEAPTLDAALREDFARLGEDIARGLEERLASLSRVACHGDCHGGNNVVRLTPLGTKTTTFFDFDDAGPGFLAYDLAVLPWSLLLRNSAETPDASFGEQWHAFLRGYQRRRPIPATDLAAVPRFIAARHLWLLGEYASRCHHWGAQALPAPWLRKQAALLSAWQALELPTLSA